MSHGSVQYHLNTIISNEQPFLGCYSFKKIEIWGYFGPKRGIYRPHMCSITALLPCELGIPMGQYNAIYIPLYIMNSHF